MTSELRDLLVREARSRIFTRQSELAMAKVIHFLKSPHNFIPELEGVQTNYYKNFICSSLGPNSINWYRSDNSRGRRIYDKNSRAGSLRNTIYHGLVLHSSVQE